MGFPSQMMNLSYKKPVSSLLTGLVSYYKLESDGTDIVGSNTLAPGIAPTYNSTAGKIGNGASFVGASSQYLNSSSFAGTSSWSNSFWMNPQLLDGSTQVFFSKDDQASTRIFSTYLTSTNIVFEFWETGGTQRTITYAHGMSTGTWYHWAGVYDAPNNLLSVYKNGTSVATFTLTGNPSAKTTSYNFILGRYNAVSGFYYTGYIDEIGHWGRALTAAEVTSLYASGSGLQYPF